MLGSLRQGAATVATPPVLASLAAAALVLSSWMSDLGLGTGGGGLLRWSEAGESVWAWTPAVAVCWVMAGLVAAREIERQGRDLFGPPGVMNGVVLFAMATVVQQIGHMLHGYQPGWPTAATVNLLAGLIWFLLFDLAEQRLFGAGRWRWLRFPNLLWLGGACLIVGAPVFRGVHSRDVERLATYFTVLLIVGFIFWLLMRVAELANRRDERELRRAQRMASRLAEERDTQRRSKRAAEQMAMRRAGPEKPPEPAETVAPGPEPPGEEPQEPEPDPEPPPAPGVSDRYVGREAFSTLRSRR